MKYILARENREVLAQIGWAHALLAFDYDGTLAPIVRDPARAPMRRRTRALFSALTERYPCAVISGRAQHDPNLWLDGIAVAALVGNHGLEPWLNPLDFEHVVTRWHSLLGRRLTGLGGVHVEDKRFSLAIHYRASREKRRALAAIREAVQALTSARIVGGKHVVNVIPAGAPHKGIALQRVRRQQGCDTALYVGDDETDEDVFALDQPGQLTTVRVGLSRTSAAQYFIKDQRELDELLRALLAARRTAGDRRKEHDGATS